MPFHGRQSRLYTCLLKSMLFQHALLSALFLRGELCGSITLEAGETFQVVSG